MDADAFHQMKCLRPKYVKDFQCDGTQCSSRCCRNWRVVIDRDTHEKLAALDDQSILERIRYVEEEKNFVVEHLANGDCPFLRDDLLCTLQKNFGADYLSPICHDYPRITYKLGDILEQSLTLTCPVAAREILLSDEPIDFEIVDLDPPRFMFDWSDRIDDVDEALELQRRAIDLLQARSLPIDRRLENVCRLIFDQSVEQKNLFDVERHTDIMIDIFDRMYAAEMSADKKARLKKIYLEHRAEVRSMLPTVVIENYLVNEFFMRCYPFSRDGDRRLACKMFVIGFKAPEFALILAAIAKGNRFGVDDILTTINAINERLDHNRDGMRAVRDSARSLADWNEFVAVMFDAD